MFHQDVSNLDPQTLGADGAGAKQGPDIPRPANSSPDIPGEVDNTPGNKKCRTNLIFDDPESTDEFGPHQQIAGAIADLVINNERSVAVGVEGGWGSGKTTVIKLLAKPLKDCTDNCALLTFDAWAHEGDPLRRTFIESIVEQLKDRGRDEHTRWIDHEQWQKKLDEMSQRSTVEQNKNIPTLGWWDKAVIVSLLFIPLGSALVGAALREDVSLKWLGTPAWKFIWEFAAGLLLTLAPLEVTLMRRWFSGDASNVWTLLLNKGVTETRVETIKTPEPTSIEFERAFVGLMDEALKKPERKIILVIDNLDRVDPEDALSIWSTLQTFLQHRPNPSYKWLNRLWTVVLYDPQGLSALWKNGSGGNASEVCKSFINKTFQIRFDVPAPVLTEWRDFLLKQLNAAFPDHPLKDLHAVYRVRALHHINRAPTVRELKLFVNQIGALHRQWAQGGERAKDEFLLSHIAYFALIREATQDVAGMLLGGRVPERQYKGMFGEEISRSLASLSFNVERDKGYQMLLSAPIRNALADENTHVLGSLAKVDGFWEVLERQVSTEWTGGEVINVARVAAALDKSGVLTGTDRHEAETIVESLCAAAEQAETWPSVEDGPNAGIAALVRWRTERAEDKGNQFAKSVVKAITKGGQASSRDSGQTFHPSVWIESIPSVLKGRDGLDLRSIYAEAVVEPLMSELGRQAPLSSGELRFSLELLFAFADKDFGEAAAGALRKLPAEPHFLKKVNGASDRGPYTLALVLRLLLTHRPEAAAEETVGAGIKGETERFLENTLKDTKGEIVANFVDILAGSDRLGMLFEILGEDPGEDSDIKEFVVRCLKHLIDSKLEQAGSLFTPEALIKHYTFLRLNVNEKPSDRTRPLVAHLLKTTPLIEHLGKNPFDETLVSLYITVAHDTSDEGFITWAYDALNGINENRWREELSKESSLIFLAHALQPAENTSHMGDAFQQALLKTAAEIAAGNFTPKHEWMYPALISSLGSGETRERLRSGLRHLAMERGAEAPHLFFALFGTEIAGVVHDPQVFSKLFLPLFKAHKYEALPQIADLLGESDLSSYQLDPPKGLIEFRDLLLESGRQGDEDPNPTSDTFEQLKKIVHKLNNAVPSNP